MFVVRCVLRVDCRSLCAVCWGVRVCCALFMVCCVLRAGRCVLFVVVCLRQLVLVGVCCVLLVVMLLDVVCWLLVDGG